MQRKIIMALPYLMVLTAVPAHAGDCKGPCVEWWGSYEAEGYWIHSKDPGIADYFEASPTLESNFIIRPAGAFSIAGTIIYESVADSDPGSNRFFDHDGLYVDQLYAQYDMGEFSIFAGKIHPAFGRAWDVTPGLRGTDLAESYELTERLGGGAVYGFETSEMTNSLTASVFTADRSILSDSLFFNRGRKTLLDGGAGNTSGMSSVALALDGCMGADPGSCYDDGQFGYQLATRYQKHGDSGAENEWGFAGSLNKSVGLSEDSALKFFGEIAYFRNFDGTEDDAVSFTGSAALVFGETTLSLAYTQQRILIAGDSDEVEHLLDASAVYSLGDAVSLAGEQWSVGAGYSFDRADGEDTQSVGLKLTADFEGSAGL